MARLLYSLAGEGRGHAARVRTIVDSLKDRHEVAIFAPGVAYQFLSDCFRDTSVDVQEIPGLMFEYSNQRLNHWKTTTSGLRYLFWLPKLVRELEDMIRLRDPDLVITDFDPALPRAARRCGVPFLSLDHQHFLTVSDLSALPRHLQPQIALGRFVVSNYCRGQAATIVSSFYFPPLRKNCCQNVVQIGNLLRSDVVERRPTNDGHIVAYLRRFAPPNVMQSLSQIGRPVHVYGLGTRPSEGPLSFHPISDHAFLDDLSSCDALICNAGNQLVGEALFLGKPIFAMPEPNNFEQEINAHFLKESGGGDWVAVADVAEHTFRNFFERREEYVCKTDRRLLHGNPAAIAEIERHLPARPEIPPRVLDLQPPSAATPSHAVPRSG